MKQDKVAVLLMNVGSPDKPEPRAVRKYLTQFLNDRRVIDLPWILQKFLVNLIIIPFRIKKSTGLYKRIWSDMGSPLIAITGMIQKKLEVMAGSRFKVFTGMRYGNPGYKKALEEIKKGQFDQLVVFPLFPQYAMSTTETAFAAIDNELKKQKIKIPVIKIDQFYNHPGFIAAFADKVKQCHPENFDHIVFTYHGLPDRQVEKCHPGIKVHLCDCKNEIPAHGTHCYRATCYATTRLIASVLGLPKGFFTTSFQSRLTKNWLSPFTDETLLLKIQEGKKKILVVAPSFVTDCLETIIEIGEDYQILFRKNGGEKLQWVESLNSDNLWLETIEHIILQQIK